MSDPADEIAMSFADAFADYMVANLLDGDADGGVVSMSPRNLVDTVSDLLADFLRDIAALDAEPRGEQPEGPTTAVSDCPTCWSTDPAKRWNDAAEAVCPDSWHGGRR